MGKLIEIVGAANAKERPSEVEFIRETVKDVYLRIALRRHMLC